MTVSIIQGGKTKFIVRLTDSTTGDPLSLSGVTQVTTCFQNKDGSELMLSMTGGAIAINSAILGKLEISLTAAQTLNLLPVENATLELAISYGGDPTKLQIENAYTVIASVC